MSPSDDAGNPLPPLLSHLIVINMNTIPSQVKRGF